jgi:hypothetical protein
MVDSWTLQEDYLVLITVYSPHTHIRVSVPQIMIGRFGTRCGVNIVSLMDPYLGLLASGHIIRITGGNGTII